jgi:hypothetical protein
MSGVASPPSATAHAEDLFALVKFIQSDDLQGRLMELQEAEQAHNFARMAAEDAVASAVMLKREAKQAADRLDADRVQFLAEMETKRGELSRALAQREAALAAREASVLQREDRCTERERENEEAETAAATIAAARNERLTQRAKELDAAASAFETSRSAMERRRAAVDQEMRP